VGQSAPAPTIYGRKRLRKGRVALLLVAAAITLAISHGSPRSSFSSAKPAITFLRDHSSEALGEAGGAVPGGTTIFDDEVPGVARLDPALLAAVRRAAVDAGGEGVDLIVNSGWRSPAYEDHLRREAVAKYGSEAEAARWVATGSTSPHVSGDAVDIGSAGAAWLAAHGAAYGLCRVYGNEPWHYELRTGASEHGCPAMYADPTQDPRLRG